MECDKCMDKNKEHELLIKQSHKRSWRGSIDLRVLVKRERRKTRFLQPPIEEWKFLDELLILSDLRFFLF